MFIYIWLRLFASFQLLSLFFFCLEFPEKYYIFVGRWKPVGVSPYLAEAPNSPRNLYLPLEITPLQTTFLFMNQMGNGDEKSRNLFIRYVAFGLNFPKFLLALSPSGGFVQLQSELSARLVNRQSSSIPWYILVPSRAPLHPWYATGLLLPYPLPLINPSGTVSIRPGTSPALLIQFPA